MPDEIPVRERGLRTNQEHAVSLADEQPVRAERPIMHKMLKVLIADDHAVVRRGLKQILEETSDIVVSGEATNSREVLEQVSTKSWDALVLDITMPGRSGLDILREVKLLAPKLPVLVLSM